MTVEEVKDYLENDEEGRGLLTSLTDKRVNDGIETFKKNHYSEELDGLQKTVEKLQAEKRQNTLKEIARSAGVPDNLLDYVIGEDEDSTQQRAVDFLASINGEIEQAKLNTTKELLKGKDPQSQDAGSLQKPLQEMTSAEILANLDKLQEAK